MEETALRDTTRNFGIIAHINAGKTTTSERMLFYSGVTAHLGEVDHGASTLDWMSQEQERGITITAAATSFHWKNAACNLIDLPGHVDFTVEVERSLRVLDGAVAIFCATRGVQPQSETVWRQADRYNIPRIAFINKCDRAGADPDAAVEAIRERLRANPIVLQMPHKLESDFDGVIDLIHLRSRRWDASSSGKTFYDADVPAEFRDEAMLARAIMLEALAEVDDSVMTKYLAEVEITPQEIKQALRRATLAMRAVPVVMGAAKKNQGIQLLLDAVVDFLPSPNDGARAIGRNPSGGEPLSREPAPDEPTSALAFKVMNDPQLGQLTFIRVYSGTISVGDKLLNSSQNRLENVERLVKMHANDCRAIDQAAAGEIAAITGLRGTLTGDTLCDPASPIVYETIRFPKPVVRMALEMEDDEGRVQLLSALQALSEEDPTFRASDDAQSGQVIITGMGELHLEIVVDRLRSDYKLVPRVGRPQVAYRSTLAEEGSVTVRHTYGGVGARGPGQFAGLTISATPAAMGSGVVIKFDPKLELSRVIRRAARKGLEEAMSDGVQGFSAADLELRVIGAEYHEVDSSELSFEIAGLKAGREVLSTCPTIVTEPVMRAEIVVNSECVGEVIGDLNARRGKITGIEARSGVQVVACLVPLASMFGYATNLRSRTQGRASYSMEFHSYAQVPSGILETLVKRTSLEE